MARGTRLLLGLWLEVRVIPVLMWSYTAVTLGTAIAWQDGQRWVAGYLAAIAVGVLLQGLVAHCANDIADWRSGTDGDPAPRMLSGGSKVIPSGLLGPRELRAVGWASALAAAGIGIAVASSRGWVVLAFGAAGLAGALLYSLPPVRAAYRPVLGEVVAFTCVWGCVAGAALLAAESLPLEAAVAGVSYAAACVAMLLLHHVLDRGPDSRALPPKRTTVVRFAPAARPLALSWTALALAAAVVLAATADAAYLALVAGLALSVPAHLSVRPDDPASVTRAELAVIGLTLLGGLLTAAILAPPLAWALVPPLLLVPVELWCSGLARRAALGSPDLGGARPAPEAPVP